jgi:hypothetical protein
LVRMWKQVSRIRLCIGVLDAAVHENKWSPYGSKSDLDLQMHCLKCRLGGRIGSRSLRWRSMRKCVLRSRLFGKRRVRLTKGKLVSGDRSDGRRSAKSIGALSCRN